MTEHFHMVIVAGLDEGRPRIYGGEKFPTKMEAQNSVIKLLEAHKTEHKHPGECPLDEALQELRARAQEVDALFFGTYGFSTRECDAEADDDCKEAFLAEELPRMALAYYRKHPDTPMTPHLAIMLLLAMDEAPADASPRDDDRPGMYL